MEYERNLMTIEEFCKYVGIGKTKAREMISKPGCKYVVHIDEEYLYIKNCLMRS